MGPFERLSHADADDFAGVRACQIAAEGRACGVSLGNMVQGLRFRA